MLYFKPLYNNDHAIEINWPVDAQLEGFLAQYYPQHCGSKAQLACLLNQEPKTGQVEAMAPGTTAEAWSYRVQRPRAYCVTWT